MPLVPPHLSTADLTIGFRRSKPVKSNYSYILELSVLYLKHIVGVIISLLVAKSLIKW